MTAHNQNRPSNQPMAGFFDSFVRQIGGVINGR
jgi:hypothetical protein